MQNESFDVIRKLDNRIATARSELNYLRQLRKKTVAANRKQWQAQHRIFQTIAIVETMEQNENR